MKYLYCIVFLSIISCSDTVTEQDLQNLNGYWDIEMVEATTKKVTKFGVNQTIDYYYLDDNNVGFRKKAAPDFSGKYKTNNLKDSITISNKDGKFIIHTKTPLASWDDIIIQLTSEKLVLQNEKGVFFHYKKHEKFNF